jgi:uncharacterized protein GlcG (DUF336 family)
MMRGLAVLAAVAALGTAAAAQGLPSRKVLPRTLAEAAALAALEACEREGWRVSAAVVDHAGVALALLRSEGAGPHTVDSSLKKAYTALSLRRATAEYARMVAGNPAIAGLRDMNENILLLGGGLPIRAGEEFVGGIGVGGAPGGDKDEACAQAGIVRIEGELR